MTNSQHYRGHKRRDLGIKLTIHVSLTSEMHDVQRRTTVA